MLSLSWRRVASYMPYALCQQTAKIKKNNFNKNERFGSRPASCTAHALTTLCSSISVCRGFVSGLLIFTPAGGAGGCFGLFSARGQRRRSGSGQPSPPRVHRRICLCPEECVSVEFRDQSLLSTSSTDTETKKMAAWPVPAHVERRFLTSNNQNRK